MGKQKTHKASSKVFKVKKSKLVEKEVHHMLAD